VDEEKFPYFFFVSCNRPTDGQALVVIVSFFRRLSFKPAYKKGGCKVVVEVGRQRNNTKIEKIKF
jgi:hypothetical protein